MILEVKNLTTAFKTSSGSVSAVNNISFTLSEGEILGLVGESGSGKSVTALSIMRLLPEPNGQIESGEVLLNRKDLLKLSEKEMCKIRGNELSMIYQEPMTALNPVFTVGQQIGEIIKTHEGIKGKHLKERVIQLLQSVQIPNPRESFKKYPHELSGGMRQRIMIAMALCCNPKVLVADEPTTALDVTIQAEILDLLISLSTKLKTSIIFITHDLDVIAEIADKVAVMYAGKIVEECNVLEFFDNPLHPYSQGLMFSRPNNKTENGRLFSIPGMVPSAYNLPLGCAFSKRCSKCIPVCLEKVPNLIDKKNNHRVSCWLYEENEG
ncbi:ABC transporter ATP-binding protein [Clostridium sp. FP2]|uniref:ABC transporter ATP-binding protein n=1 Tax=Clostridium sp. FP2 TaxID=2724481 RepID=UPI0013E96DD9|nr:ABC transporter ATP-binding protein [Clostridium sp. FP2]MBZ9624895.1 ABC transporter ATP-binding protein [Clostridium sp. FP2]